jgi:hypothetical protein
MIDQLAAAGMPHGGGEPRRSLNAALIAKQSIDPRAP